MEGKSNGVQTARRPPRIAIETECFQTSASTAMGLDCCTGRSQVLQAQLRHLVAHSHFRLDGEDDWIQIVGLRVVRPATDGHFTADTSREPLRGIRSASFERRVACHVRLRDATVPDNIRSDIGCHQFDPGER